ncbi:MAG: hypothetical protein V2J89_01870 [Halieaceae bacterium]|jgi:hypothetical protein|nr:hypothetical protein [Halieaceae bacterium]
MTQFEFILTLFSILIALMVGRVINTLSSLSFATADRKHIGWLFALLLNLMVAYWVFWEARNDVMTFAEYLAFLTTAGCVIYAVSVLTPASTPRDWSAYFWRVRARFFSAYLAFWASDALFDYLLDGTVKPAIAPIASLLLGALSRDNRAQWAALLLFLLVQVVFIVLLLMS